MTLGAVVLAAGFGTRLAPLTDRTPKPLLEVGARPVASHLVERLRELDADLPIIVVVNGRHPEAWAAWVDETAGHLTLVSNGVIDEHERLGAIADLGRGLDALPAVDTVPNRALAWLPSAVHAAVMPSASGSPCTACDATAYVDH